MGIEHEGEILLTATETAEYLGVCKSSVSKMCRKGILTSRIGPKRNANYVTLMSVLAYARSEKVTLRELAARITKLEHRLDRMLVGEDSKEVSDFIRQTHPHLEEPSR